MARVRIYSWKNIFYCKPRIVTHTNDEVKRWRPLRAALDPCILPHDNHTAFFRKRSCAKQHAKRSKTKRSKEMLCGSF